jgi:hypothetical protein
MKILKTVPLFLFLLVVFFILHGTVENFGFIYPAELFRVGLTILISVLFFYAVTKLLVKQPVHAALICFFISSWILFFGAIFEWVKSIHFLKWLHSYSVFIPFMLCVFILFILFIRKKTALQNKLCFYLNVLLLIYCLYDSGTLVLKAIQTKPPSFSTAVNFDTAVVKAKPNVYFLLFDEYPGYKGLKDSFAFANDDLYLYLEKKNFKFLPVFSNYNMTFYSMASMLNMEYIDKPYKALQNTIDDDQMRINEVKNARAIQYFKTLGYSFINYSIFDILEQPSFKSNSFVISQAKLLTHKIFFNKVLHDIGWNFIYGKYSIPYIKYIYMQEDRNNKFFEKKIIDTDRQNAPSPSFVYAHFNMPHQPVFYDSAGNYLPVSQIFDPQTYYNKPFILSYIKYTNNKIKNLVDTIVKKDSTAVVIVISDHGYRGYGNNNSFTPLLFDNICAVKFPDKNYLPFREKWSNVNFFRYLFNCEFNQKIPYLPDSAVFLKDKLLQTD